MFALTAQRSAVVSAPDAPALSVPKGRVEFRLRGPSLLRLRALSRSKVDKFVPRTLLVNLGKVGQLEKTALRGGVCTDASALLAPKGRVEFRLWVGLDRAGRRRATSIVM